MSVSLSRRSLAKGAAWAAPAVVATTTIPAYAASSRQPYGSVCKLFFGRGTVNAQRTDIYLSVVSSTTNDAGQPIIKAGQTVTWTLYAPSANGAPVGNYAGNGSWTVTSSGTAPNFVVTLTAHEDVLVSDINCIAKVVWDSASDSNSTAIKPKTQANIASSSDGGSYGFNMVIPQRFGTSVNDSRRTPVYIDGTCYPTIQWSYLGNSSRYNRDNLLVFNSGDPITPDTNAGNDQKVTTGTCTE